MLQGRYLDVNGGSANRTGWNSKIGCFVSCKSTNNVRIMQKFIRSYDATNSRGRGRYRNCGRKYPT